MTMNPPQAIKIIEAVKKEGNAQNLVSTANTIALETPVWVIELSKRIRDLNAKIDSLLAQTAPAAAPAPAFDTGSQVPPSGRKPTQRFNADGTPMSAEDAALEDAMDAASAGGGGAEMASGPAPVPPAQAAPVKATKPVTAKPKMASVPNVAAVPNGNANGGTDAKA